MKLKGTTVGLVPLLVSMLNINGYSLATETNIGEYIENSPNVVADFIEDNFDKMVVEYNKQADDKWNACHVEERLDITIEAGDDIYQGVYLDFDDDNGYAVLGKDYTFLDFAIDGESPYEGIESDSYYYSALSGYLYFDGEEYVNVDESKNTSEEISDTLNYDSEYAGQQDNASGCGHIQDTGLYIADRYGSGWSLESQKSLEMTETEYNRQLRLSCYKKNKLENGNVEAYSEGNCWMVAAYNVLQSMADAKTYAYRTAVKKLKTDMLKADMSSINSLVDYDPKVSEPEVYNKYFDSYGNNISARKKKPDGTYYYEHELFGNSKMPSLYASVREYVSSKFKRVDGGTVYDTASIINDVGSKYGYSFNAKGSRLVGIYASAGIKSISQYNLPFVLATFSFSNAGYSDHEMAGCGYRVYSKKSGWWLFTWTDYVYLYELRDGHSKDKIYFDLSAWTGLGGIVLLDYGLFKY